jgi:hypothetical protein
MGAVVHRRIFLLCYLSWNDWRKKQGRIRGPSTSQTLIISFGWLEGTNEREYLKIKSLTQWHSRPKPDGWTNNINIYEWWWFHNITFYCQWSFTTITINTNSEWYLQNQPWMCRCYRPGRMNQDFKTIRWGS